MSVELTYYNKHTKDALIERDIAPSLGRLADAVRQPVADPEPAASRLAINTRIIDKPSIAWDLKPGRVDHQEQGSGSGCRGEQHLRRVLPAACAGYPAGGFWAPTVSFNDADGDGIIDLHRSPRSATARSSAAPPSHQEASLNSQLAIFSGRVVIGTQFDYRGGHLVDNSLEQFRCFSVQNCRGLYANRAA